MRRENEAVVNRFLLSTLYIILGEFLLFFMYKGSISAMAINMPSVLYALMTISVAGMIVCIVFMVLGKGNLAYYITICAVVLLIALFLRFYYIINIPAYVNVVMYTSRRYAIAGAFAFLFYVYEVIFYFMNVNKPQK